MYRVSSTTHLWSTNFLTNLNHREDPMNVTDCIRVVGEVSYPRVCEEVRMVSRTHSMAIGSAKNIYDSRSEYHGSDETMYVEIGGNWECHGVAPILVAGRRFHQYYSRRYRKYIITDTHYYSGFVRSDIHRNEPLFSYNLGTGQVVVYHNCKCRFCDVKKMFPGYVVKAHPGVIFEDVYHYKLDYT